MRPFRAFEKLILSAEMMLRHLGWNEAADRIVKGLSGAIAGDNSDRVSITWLAALGRCGR